ncbi:hypothetical protein M9Y10_012760 [Tritrichomonas musculus]|uniref:Right handed beta helix domain-containing protein n=1 Tax=Tritrichomonas musculus TaxID=1915356 RepID=A0ABR2IDH5_9EUKA
MLFLASLILFQIHRVVNPNDVQRGEHTVITENTVIHDVNVESTDCQSGKQENGGLYLIEAPASSVNFTNCKFSHCFTVQYTLKDIYGGVLYFSNIENTFISNSSFTNCSSPSGGAVGLSNVSLAVFENTNFTQNSAIYYMFIAVYGNGGAICFDKTNGCSFILDGCLFDSNVASTGAAIYTDPNLDELLVKDCLFINNIDQHYPGAAIRAGVDIYTTPVKKASLISSKFINNSNVEGSDYHLGSTIYMRVIDFTFKNCDFSKNHGVESVNCPVMALKFVSLDPINEVLIDSCTFSENIGSLLRIEGECIDSVSVYNCIIVNNTFIDKGAFFGDPLPPAFTYENCIFTNNTGNKNTCHSLNIPSGHIRRTKIISSIFNAKGIKTSGPSVLIESFTEILNTSFTNHKDSTLSIKVSNAELSIKSITFTNNSCTDPLAGNDGLLCEGSNVSFSNNDLTQKIVIKSANTVVFNNSLISRFGVEIEASFINVVDSTIFSLSGKSSILLTGINHIFAKNITCYENSVNYLQFSGTNNQSQISILNSSFKYSPIQVSNAGIVCINGSQFNLCLGNLKGGALSIDNHVLQASIYKCAFTECQSKVQIGGAIYADIISLFTLELTSFDKCKSTKSGSCLYLYGGERSTINNCTFHNDDENNAASVYISDKSEDCQTIFVNGCFSSDAVQSSNDDVLVRHIYSASLGIVSFNYPMCFDRSKEESVFFEKGQDADKGYNCYNCLDCGKMPRPEPTSIPTGSPVPPTIVPTEVPTPTDDDSDSGNKKLKTPVIVGIVIGCVVIIIIIIVIIIIVVRRKNAAQELDPTQLIPSKSPLQLNTQENLPDNNE